MALTESVDQRDVYRRDVECSVDGVAEEQDEHLPAKPLSSALLPGPNHECYSRRP